MGNSGSPTCDPARGREEAEEIFGAVRELPQIRLSRRLLFKPSDRLSVTDVYQLGKAISEGSFATVQEAWPIVDEASCSKIQVPLAASKRPVAIKAFKQASSASPQIWRAKRSSFDVEQMAFAILEHPHIVQLYGSFAADDDQVHLALEFCRGGDLFSRVEAERRLEESIASRIFWQMAITVSYLHGLEIIHQDLKMENWLFLDEGVDTVKLCDFGTVTRLSKSQPRALRPAGTLTYRAPEAHRGQGVSFAADSWALGVALYSMLFGEDPFLQVGDSKQDTIQRLCAGTFGELVRESGLWLQLSEAGRDLISKLLSVDEAQRLSSIEATRHSWPTCPSLHITDLDMQQYGPRILEIMESFTALHVLQQLLLVACARISSISDLDVILPQSAVRAQVPWYEVFMHWDEDHDGRLSLEELTMGLQPFAARASAHLQFTIHAVDVDDSGYIEWAEWIGVALLSWVITANGLATTEEPLRSVVRLLDAPTCDGTVTASDLAGLAPQAREVDLQQSINDWAKIAHMEESISGLELADLQRMLDKSFCCWSYV